MILCSVGYDLLGMLSSYLISTGEGGGILLAHLVDYQRRQTELESVENVTATLGLEGENRLLRVLL